MNIAIVDSLIKILLPLVQNLIIYQMGKSNGKDIVELENIKENNIKLKKLNKLLNYKIKVANEINKLDRNDIYNQWV